MYTEITVSSFAVVISVLGLFISIFTHFSILRRDRKQATLEAYNVLQEQALDKLNAYKPAQIKDIAKNSNSSEFKRISEYMARIEHFCVGINNKVYDMTVLVELADGYLNCGIYKRVMPIIEKKQAYSKEQYYDNFEKVVNKMNNRSKRKALDMENIKQRKNGVINQ